MQSSAAAAMQAQYEMLGTRTAEKYDVFRLVNSVEAPHFRIEPRVLFQVRGKKPNMPDLTYAENHIKTEHEKHKKHKRKLDDWNSCLSAGNPYEGESTYSPP